MSKILFEPGSPTYKELVGNGKIHDVPKYQRDYSWDSEDWDDLWNDIEGITTEQIHYMGYVVLQGTTDTRRYWVIDGQQRITTLSILAIAALDLLQNWVDQDIEPDINKRRINLLENSFVAIEIAKSNIPLSKLNLNRNNDDFYKSYLLRRRRPTNQSKLKPSERKLWRSFEFFKKKLEEKFSRNKDGQAVEDFLERTIGDRLVFTTITVGDDLNAYKVFETLNARGVKLSTGDLLKNYLFSEVARDSEHDLDEAERMWQNINDALQKVDLPTFIRHYWNSSHHLQTKTTLFKAIKTETKGSIAVFDFLDSLQSLAPVYAELNNAASELWNTEQSVHIEELDLFGSTQCYTLLMAAYKHIKPTQPEEFTKICRDLAVTIFRYTTISQFNPNIIETEMNKISIEVSRGQLHTAREVFQSYEKSLYTNDETFANNFIYRSINTKRYKALARYILVKIERYLSGVPVDWNDPKVSIEHILPENAGSDWDSFFSSEQQEESVYRIGNLTLLESSKNRDAGAKLMEEKLPIYHTSQYELTKEKSNYEEWKPVTLQSRSKTLAQLAKTVWKVNY